MVIKQLLGVLLSVLFLIIVMAPTALAAPEKGTESDPDPEITAEPTPEPTEEPEEDEPRPFLTVPFEDYTVTEGLLLCAVAVLVLGPIIRIVWGWLCGF